MAFKSYCWSIGTTSFRVSQLNYKIERQLQLLKEFWNNNPTLKWNESTQGKYYYHLKDNKFLDGEASLPSKDAREKTSGIASYNENGGWTEKDEEDLLKYLSVLDKSGVKFALSNVIEHKGEKNLILDAWIRENNYKVHIIESDYNNSNYHKQEGNITKTTEVLVTNY